MVVHSLDFSAFVGWFVVFVEVLNNQQGYGIKDVVYIISF